MAKKSIKYQYFFIFQTNSGKKQLFPFVKFITEFNNLDKDSYTIDISDYKAKVEKISKIDNRYIHVCFTKLNDKNIPKKSFADKRESLELEINSDEYIGTDVHTIYDTHNNALMVQSSRESLSVSGISYYIREFARKLGIIASNDDVEILPIYDTKSPNKECSISKIDVKFANIEKIHSPKNANINQILKTMTAFDGLTGSVCISVGRQRKHSLSNSEVLNFLSELKIIKNKNKECVPSAKISYSENDLTFVYDLFDDILNDIGYVDILPRTYLKFEDIEKNMMEIYQKRLPYLNNLIKKMRE